MPNSLIGKGRVRSEVAKLEDGHLNLGLHFSFRVLELDSSVVVSTCGTMSFAGRTAATNNNSRTMKINRTRPIPLIASILATCCATNAFATGPTLSEIPPLDGVSANEGRAITRDGQYVVGLSGSSGYLYQVGSAGAVNVVSSDGAQSTVANGVGYRTALDPVYATNRTEIIIAGMSAGFATEWMTPDGGTSYGGRRRNASDNYSTAMGVANQVGSSLGTDAYYVTHYNSNLKSILCLGQGVGQWLATYAEYRKGTSADLGSMNGVSASGRSVGWRGTSASQANKRSYMLTYPASPAFLIGLAGSDSGEAHSISADGNTVFGRSKTVSDPNNYYAFKTTFSGGAGGINGTTQGSVDALPEYSDTAGSVTRAVPYGCTADGLYAVGMNYRGQERAVVWDTSNPNPAIWTVLDLTDLAKYNGFLGDFTLNLRRAYSAGTNGSGDLVVTGLGVNSGVTTRGFVMTIPKWIAAIGFPGNQTVAFGASGTISIKTNATDSLSYQWYHNGTALAGQTSTSVSYANATCAGGQAGTYSVVINNPSVSGVVTGAMTLTVLDPNITTQPVSVTNIEGTTATFTVSADSSGGAGSLSYKWQRNGSDLTDGPTGWGSTIAGSSTATLSISSVTLADGTNTSGSGVYSVRVTTSAGGCSTTSRSATLNVLGRPYLSPIVDGTGGNYTLTIDGPAGKTYDVLYSTDIMLPLSSWSLLTSGTLPGYPITYVDAAPTDAQRFYIVKIVYP
jgi:hypothetical protein